MPLPYGIFLGYLQTALPWLLRQVGYPVDQIGSLEALVLAPMALYFLWSPLVDFWLRRRTWIVILASLSAVMLATAILLLERHPALATWMLLAGFAVNLLTTCCSGALIALTQDEHGRAKAAAWMQGGMLTAQALGGALLLYLSRRLSTPVTAVVAAALVAAPALVALTIREQVPHSSTKDLWQTCRTMGREVRATLFAWKSLPAILILMSPVGTAAAQSLFAAMAREYHVGEQGVLLLNGILGGVLTMLGAFAAVVVPAHWDRRIAYAGAGLACAVSGVFLVFAPMTPMAYYAGVAVYMFTCGACYAFFLGVVMMALGEAGKSGSSRYAILVSLGNLPVVYMTKIEGVGYGLFGARAVPALDAAGNLLVAIAVALWIAVVVTRKGRKGKAPILSENLGL
jgi:MFS transporter, PAT family, beta-lactamase induction signal transducer AmpG